ncbi:MAG: YigZ family protein [Clostridia bacterium]|nr:YigZ family protein [Clostridia bacterium]
MSGYKTVLHEASAEIIEKRSRFIGYCKNTAAEADAIDFINTIRAKHRDASHNVYAYCVRENNMSRYSDDGEPQGTAGLPVLDVIRKENLTDICIVVTRYFGGVLLGTGGLVRAYSKSAKLGVDAAVRVEMTKRAIVTVRTDYRTHQKLEYALRERGFDVRDTAFAESVVITIAPREEELDALCALVTDSTQGSSRPEKIGEEFVPQRIES